MPTYPPKTEIRHGDWEDMRIGTREKGPPSHPLDLGGRTFGVLSCLQTFHFFSKGKKKAYPFFYTPSVNPC